MPLREVCDTTSLENGNLERFFVFFSSRLPESGLLWCPDCVAVEDSIRNAFGSEQGPPAVLAYVGQRSEWKAPENMFRKAPWNIQAIPTIVKLNEAGEEIGRLVDGRNSISKELSSFIQQ